MPFTQKTKEQKKFIQKILFLSFENSLAPSISFQFAQNLQKKEHSEILWIDGNLGSSNSEKIYEPLEKVLNDKAALSKAIRHTKEISTLSGKTNIPFELKPQDFQNQVFCDLETLSTNYKRIVVSSTTRNKNLQNLWLNWADKKYLFFQNENIFFEDIVCFLQNCPYTLDGLIFLGTNSHQAELMWLRLKKMIPDPPKLVLDIEKTAQEI